MPLNIINVSDWVINNQSQTENKSKKRHAIDGIAKNQVDKQCQRKADRHRQTNNHCRSPAHRECQQSDHSENREHQTGKQFINLFVGGFPIVTGNEEVNFRGNNLTFKLFGFGNDFSGNIDTLVPFFLLKEILTAELRSPASV